MSPHSLQSDFKVKQTKQNPQITSHSLLPWIWPALKACPPLPHFAHITTGFEGPVSLPFLRQQGALQKWHTWMSCCSLLYDVWKPSGFSQHPAVWDFSAWDVIDKGRKGLWSNRSMGPEPIFYWYEYLIDVVLGQCWERMGRKGINCFLNPGDSSRVLGQSGRWR